MKRFLYFFTLAAALMAVSCQRELPGGEEDIPLVYGDINVTLGQADPINADGSATKSLISVDTEDFVDAYLFAFNASTKKILTYTDGSPMAIYTTSKSFDWTLAIGTKMDIWVVVNPGSDNTWKTALQSAVTNKSLTESDLYDDKLMFKCASSSALMALETSGAHLPMSAMENGITLTSPTQTLSIKVKRLFAKYNIYLDTSLLEAEGYTVKSTYLASSKSNTEVPFFYQTDGVLGGYAQTDVSKLATIDRNTEEDLTTLENGQKVTLYFLENCQGTKTGASKWSSVYKDLGASAVELCSYMEVGVNVSRSSASGKEAVDESYAWRIYLGKTDMKSDFNVERNLFKTIKLTLPVPEITEGIDDPVQPVDGFKFTNTNSLSVAPGETITVPFETSVSNRDDIVYEIYQNGVRNYTAFDKIEPKTFKPNTTKKTAFAYEGTVALTASSSVNEETYELKGGDESFKFMDMEKLYVAAPLVLDFAYSDDFLHSGHPYGAGYEALHVGRRGYITVNYTSGSLAVKTIQWSVNSAYQSDLKIGTDGDSFTPVTSANDKNGVYLYCYNGGQSGAMLSYKVIGLDDSVIQEGTLNLQLMMTVANSDNSYVYIPAIRSKKTPINVSVKNYSLVGIGSVSASDLYTPLANSIGLFNDFTSFTAATSNPEFSISGANVSYAPTSEAKFIQHINSCTNSRNGYYNLGNVNVSNGLLTMSVNVRLLAPFVTGNIISAEDTGYGQWNNSDTWYKTFDFTNRYTRNNAAMTGDVISQAIEQYGNTYEDFKSHFNISYEIDAPGDNTDMSECATIAAWLDDSRQAVTYGYEKKFTYATDKWTDYKTAGDLKPAKGTIYIQYKDGTYLSNKYPWFEFYRAVSYGVYLDASVTLNGIYWDFAVTHHIVSFNFPNLIQNPSMGTIGEVSTVYYIENGPWQVVETTSTNDVRSWIRKGMTWANINKTNSPYECSVIAGDAGASNVGNLSSQNPIYIQRFTVEASNQQMYNLMQQCYYGGNMDAFYKNYAPQIQQQNGIQSYGTASDGTHYFAFKDTYFNRGTKGLIIFIPCQTPNYTPVYPSGVYSGGPVPASYYNDIICWGRPW